MTGITAAIIVFAQALFDAVRDVFIEHADEVDGDVCFRVRLQRVFRTQLPVL